jgi:pSer/pThr/pTyr-binding forkhead associated (FHA) protein
VEQVLLGLKALFLVLLYLFIWRVIRGAARDLAVPQESFILAPAQARAAGLGGDGPAPAGRLLVLESKAVKPGTAFETGAVALTIGRAPENTVPLPGDAFASGHHARIESSRDGIWLFDVGSTNGTFVNGERINGRTRLHDGDVITVGDTEFRYER